MRAYLILAALAAARGRDLLHPRLLTRDKVDDRRRAGRCRRRAGRGARRRRDQDRKVARQPASRRATCCLEIDPADLDVEVARGRGRARRRPGAGRTPPTRRSRIVESTSPGGLSSAQGAADRRGRLGAQRADAQIARRARPRSRAPRPSSRSAEADLDRAEEAARRRTRSRGQQLEHAPAARDSRQGRRSTPANAQLAAAREQQARAQSRVAEAQGHVDAERRRSTQQVAAAHGREQARRTRASRRRGRARHRRSSSAATRRSPRRPPASISQARRARRPAWSGRPGAAACSCRTTTYVVANFKETQIGRMKRRRSGRDRDRRLSAATTFHGMVDERRRPAPARGSR